MPVTGGSVSSAHGWTRVRSAGWRAIARRQRTPGCSTRAWSPQPRRRQACRSGANCCATRSRRRPRLDAVFCNNDDLALGVLFECNRALINGAADDRHRRLQRPRYDAGRLPSLTSVRTHRYDIGRRAVAMARARIDGQPVERPVVDIGFELMPRERTARSHNLWILACSLTESGFTCKSGSATISQRAGVRAFLGLFLSYYMINHHLWW